MKKYTAGKLKIGCTAFLIAIAAFSFSGFFQVAYAQGSAQVTVNGIPPTLNSPYTDQIEQNFRSGRYQAVFTFNSSSRTAVDFQFRLTLLKDGKQIINITSNPKSFRPGAYVFTSLFNDIPFPQTFKEVINSVDPKLRKKVLQEGTLPEGNYVLKVKPIPADNGAAIASAPAMTPFTVRFPQPPRLINPANEATVTMDTPVFNWTPIAGLQGQMVQYDFLLVEVLPNQTPLQALNSNRAIVQKTLTNKNTLLYTPQYLPLEKGQQYVWRITAHLPNSEIPIKNEGESEFQTFVYKSSAGDESLAGVRQLQSLPLVPGFANLTQLDNLKITDQGNTFLLNGKASLQLQFSGENPETIQVRVQNLRLQKGSLSSPVIQGGTVRGSAQNIASHIASIDGHLDLDTIRWRFGKGVTASASLASINGKDYSAQGRLHLDASGAEGTVRAEGSPLLDFSKGIADVQINKLQASFPQGTITGDGKVEIMGQGLDCGTVQFALVDDKISTTYNCDSGFDIPLVKGSKAISMNVKSLNGSIEADLSSKSLRYDLNLDSSVGLTTEKGNSCGFDALVTASDDEGFSVQAGQQRCSEVHPKIDLGFMKFEPTHVALNQLQYHPQAKQPWDFALNLSAKLHIPTFGSWKSYDLNDIRIDTEGIHFKKVAFQNTGIKLPNFKIHDFGIRLTSLKLNNFTFPLFKWDQKGPGPWDISFSGKVAVPNSNSLPQCVRRTDLDLTQGKVSKNKVIGSVKLSNFSGCSFPLGRADYKINLNSLAGTFGVKYPKNGKVKPVGRLEFGGSLSLGSPFSCADDEEVTIGKSHFTFSNGVRGIVKDVVPPCDMKLGPFSVKVTDSKLRFSHSPKGGDSAAMQASAELTLPQGQKVQGSFILDMMTGRFRSVSFDINQPFKWEIPQDDPVLAFNIDRAHIDKDGFLVDGRQKLVLKSGANISTTFDSLKVGLRGRGIKSGSIFFDSNFSLQAGIQQKKGKHKLTFKAVKKGDKFDLKPGLQFDLPGHLTIDKNGLHTNGTANAAISFKNTTYDKLVSVDFSKNFSLQLFPIFKVGSGQADFNFKGSTCAFVDPSGFHPSTGFFGAVAKEVLPAKLPLPRDDIAYLKIRKGGKEKGKLLVQATKNKSGDFEISTKKNQPLSLYAPGLDPGNSKKPPVLSKVSLSNIVVSGDPTNPAVKSGSITANVPSSKASSLFPNNDVPVKIKTIKFGTLDNGPLALYLLGDLHLFKNDLASAKQQAVFYINKNGKLKASLDITKMNSRIPLMPQHPKKMALKVDSVSGSFGWKIGSGSPTYDLSVSGGLQIHTDAGHKRGASLTMELSRPKGGNPNFNISNFDTTGHSLSSGLSLGNSFALQLNHIKSKKAFSYSKGSGFQFDITMDVGLQITPKSGDPFTFPINGLEISDNGIILPQQTIDEGSIPGLNVPAIALGGFSIQPLRLQTPAFTWNWTQGKAAFDPNVKMDFKVDLPPSLKNKLNLQDGITFNNVGLEDGYLTGSADVQQILGGADIPLMKDQSNAPVLHVTSIEDSLSGNAQQGQLVNIDFKGTISDLPVFESDKNSKCPTSASFSLSLVQSKYFEGQISGVSPCGYIALGPAQLSLTNANLDFAFSKQQQHATLTGGVQVSLPGTGQGPPVTVSGRNISFDLLTGKINSGSINIDKSFALSLPYKAQNPLFNFTVNQAVLDKHGLEIDGSGDIDVPQMTSNPTVQFNQFQLGFGPFEVTGGSASISAQLGLELGLGQQGFALQLKDPATPMSVPSGIDMDIGSGVSLDKNGIALTGNSSAHLKFQDKNYASLNVNFANDAQGKGFRFNLDGSGVHSGKAKFFNTSNGNNNLIGILTKDGFNPLSGIVAALPKKLGLPTDKIAYIQLKDQNGNPKVDVKSQHGGYKISTKKNQPLSVVMPALPDQSGKAMQVDVTFSLTTDGSYHVNGGSLSLVNAVSLQSRLNVPLMLTKLQLKSQGGNTNLQTGLKVKLPEPLKGKNVTANATLGKNGFSGTVTAGNYVTTYNSNLSPLVSSRQNGTLANSNSSDSFGASLYGVKVSFGNGNTAVHLAGAVRSSLIMKQGDDPIFYTAGYSSGGWDFDLDPGDAVSSLNLGKTSLALNQQNGLALHSDQQSFYLVLNGTVSLQNVLNEPLDFSVQNLEVGLDHLDSNPKLHFALGQSSGKLATQTFTLFDGALEGTLKNPTLTLQGHALSIGSSSGNVTFLKQQIDYSNLSFSTDGGFTFDEISLTTPKKLIGDNLKLKSLALEKKSSGLRLNSKLQAKLPKPIDKSETTTLSIYRGQGGKLQVDGPDFAFDLNKKFTLGKGASKFGYFKLTKVAAEIDPNNWKQSGIYANGELYKNGKKKPIVTFGEAGNITSNPGIGISPAYTNFISFNATGNTQFTFKMSIFEVTVGANKIAAKDDKFQVTLGGQAGINLKKASGSFGYEGFKVSDEGIEKRGNITNSGSIHLAGIATLSVGEFRHKVYDKAHSIKIAKTSSEKPARPGKKQNNPKVPTQTKKVKELLCFGPCPAYKSYKKGKTGHNKDAIKLTIGKSKNKDGSGIGGGVKSVFYYRTASGERALSIKNMHVEMGKFLKFNANMKYKKFANKGVLLRVAASGKFKAGNASAGAALAGKFYKKDGEHRYGLFVAVQAEAGVPIVPGVVTMTGIGGGYFYRPTPDDFDNVTNALSSLDYNPQKIPGQKKSANGTGLQRLTDNNNKFAAILYAGVSIIGQGKSASVVQGSMLIAVTSSGVFMDARGSVLGMNGKGSPALSLQAGMDLTVQWKPHSYVGGAIWIDLKLPPNIIKGSGKIEFFVTKKSENQKPVWGIIGTADFDIVKKLHADADFLVGNPEHKVGFLISGKMSAGFSVPIITLKASVSTSVWWFQKGSDVKLPFGAYVKFKAKACVAICISATAKGAMAKTQSGFKIYAAVKGCVNVVVKKACLAAWASIKTAPFKVHAGLGKSKNNDLIAQANRQKKSFKQKLKQVQKEIKAAQAELKKPKPFPGFGVSAAEVRQAGANLYGQSYITRNNLRQNFDFDLPTVINNKLMGDVFTAQRSYKSSLQSGMFSASATRQKLQQAQSRAKSLSKQVKGKLAKGLTQSIKARKAAAKAFDKMLTSLQSSPVSNVSNVNNVNTSSSASKTPSFRVDEKQAQNQRQKTKKLDEHIKKLDKRYRKTIAQVDSTLADMQGLLKPEISASLNVQKNQGTGIAFSQSNNQNSSQKSTAKLSYTPGVQDLTQQYARVLSLKRKYYALEANKRWLDVDWAKNLRSTLHQNKNQIQSGIQTMESDFSSAMNTVVNNRNIMGNNGMEYVNYMELVADVVNMNYYLKRFSGDNKGKGDFTVLSDPFTRSSKSSSAPNEISNAYNLMKKPWKVQTSTLTNDVTTAYNRFLYDMHDKGLATYADQKAQTVSALQTKKQNKTYKLLKPYRKLTALVDKFYTNKAALSSILYNMVDNYLQWRKYNKTFFEDTSATHYRQRKKQLSDALIPPQITSISANPSRPANGNYQTYFSKAEITWNATHPRFVIENSVDVKEGLLDTDISVGRGGGNDASDYVSVGDKTSVTVYPFKTDNDGQQRKENTKTINVGVRARGAAGNTAIRRAKFDVSVGPNGQSVSSGSDVMAKDTDPPMKPLVGVSSYYDHTTSLINGQQRKVYWTSNKRNIKLSILSSDPESDIKLFEYAVGSKPGATDVIGWSELHGSKKVASVLTRMDGRTKLLRMKPGKPYYLSVRVTNGAGKVSDVRTKDDPIIYDGQPPSKPSNTLTNQKFMSVGQQYASFNFSYNGPIDPVLQTVPPLNANLNSYSKKQDNGKTPEVSWQWKAAKDTLSGIKEYEYIVTSLENIKKGAFAKPGIGSTSNRHITADASSFNDSTYVYVRAVDYAGNTGIVKRFGPFLPEDPTKPKVGKMQAKIDPQDLKLYYTKMPIDPETGLKGVQYAIGTQPGKTDVRTWSKDDQVDFKIGFVQLLSILTGQKRYVSIPTKNLPVGKDLYISYRVVNGQDMQSTRRVTGPVNLDRTQPKSPDVDLTFTLNSGQLSIDVSNLKDPESGIQSVGYMVFKNSNGYGSFGGRKVRNLTQMMNSSSPHRGTFSESATTTLSNAGIGNYTDYSVRIIVTNGAGLQHSVEVDLSSGDLTGGFMMGAGNDSNIGF